MSLQPDSPRHAEWKRLMRLPKAELADRLLELQEKWPHQGESATPIYDSLAHLDPRPKQSGRAAQPKGGGRNVQDGQAVRGAGPGNVDLG